MFAERSKSFPSHPRFWTIGLLRNVDSTNQSSNKATHQFAGLSNLGSYASLVTPNPQPSIKESSVLMET
jgi:hypothetical protein